MQRALVVLAACFLVSLAGRASADARVHVVAGVPAWVEHVAVPDVAPDGEHDVRELLFDRQVRLDARASTTFQHRAFRIERAVAVTRVAEIPIAFAYDERLDLRFLRRIRNGVAIDALPRTNLRVIEPEEERGEGIYDGDRLAILVLEDLRAGDTVELGYTLTRNLGRAIARHTDASVLGTDADVALARFRLSWPPGLALDRRLFEVADEWIDVDVDGELVLVAEDMPGLETPPDEQGAIDTRPRIQWSEYASFAEVAAWAAGVYARPRTSSPEWIALVRELEALGPLEARVRGAIRFVQEDVRYLGLEIGERAVVPSPPDEVLRRRYGDCKDKALLLSALLGAFGIEAYPALVDSTRGPFLRDLLPSPFDFDHVVVGFVLDGREHFVDPTLTFERGPIDAMPSLPYRLALRVRPGEHDLVEVPIVEPDQPGSLVDERFEPDESGGAMLRVSSVFQGAEANAMRERIATESIAALEAEFLDFYGRTYEGIATAAPLSITDDETRNVVRVEERYRIPRFFEDGRRELLPWSLSDHLEEPDEDEPVTLTYPLNLHHVITVVERSPTSASEERELRSEGLDLRRSVRRTGRETRIETRLSTHRSDVPEDALAAHRSVVHSMRSLLAYEVRKIVPVTRPRGNDVPFSNVLAFVAVLGLSAPLAVRSLRAARARRDRLAAPPGTPAAAPAPARGLDEAA